MSIFSKLLRGSLFGLTLLAGLVIVPRTQAGYTALEQYEFQGQSGTEKTLAPSSTAAGILGMNVMQSAGLTPSAGMNSMNASGWNTSGQFYSVGFTVANGYTATISQLILTSKSSATGPGSINLEVSVGGAAFYTVATITQTGTAYNDEFLNLNSTVTATQGQSVVFEFLVANQTSANGGTIGSAGTFRIGDYNPAGTPTPFTLNGTITPNATVPEPATASLMAIGLAMLAVATRRRFQIS